MTLLSRAEALVLDQDFSLSGGTCRNRTRGPPTKGNMHVKFQNDRKNQILAQKPACLQHATTNRWLCMENGS